MEFLLASTCALMTSSHLPSTAARMRTRHATCPHESSGADAIVSEWNQHAFHLARVASGPITGVRIGYPTGKMRCPGLASKCGFLRSMYSARARKDVADGSAHKNLAHGRYDLAKSPTFPPTSACGVQATNTHPGGQPRVPTASVPPPVSPWPGPTRWKPPVTAARRRRGA